MSASQKRNGSLDDEITVLRGALTGLYELLEAFAPAWYSTGARQAAEHALRVRCKWCEQEQQPTQR